MMCDKCGKKPATTLVRQNINGKYNEYRLCSDCASEEKIFGNFADFFPSFVSAPVKQLRSDEVCPFCGSTTEEISRSGRAGCAKCYSVFGSLFDPYIQKLHGKAKHVGRIPASAGKDITLKKEINDLREKLAEAVKSEDYEHAAEYRDKLRELENKKGEE